ncbi:MAG: GGDEF domain-containing protein [Sphingomonadales bacterium]|nr:GGDEF domain-containing protein [Sphingomonadales bacterium]
MRWLGFGRHADRIAVDASADPQPAAPADAARVARLTLLADVTLFLDTHDIDVTALTLAAAHDYLTGSDVALVRAIDRRLGAGLPITAEWLETASQEDGRETARESEREALNTLMTRLESNLDEFGKTTHAARSAANEYSSALEAHVGGLGDDPDGPASMISELASLARAMLTRTRDLEREMSRSELQTRTLRRSLDQARRTAEKDHLTGLPNRRAFDSLLESELAVASAEHEHLCVAFCDIDDFKRINDTHGHEAGDRVLRAVAQNLARISNDRCHVARHGGEEFVILFRGLTLNEAWDVLDEARIQQSERRLVNRANDMPFGKVTFSGGMADMFAYAEPRAALRAADQALYRAKEQGRNRIELAARGEG